ncbi:hypothetical protein TNCV_2535511 [Trichonephila clavipes]|nr:hypothetical protein TNCV_2535511 [Trichonephila clavipes]
MNPGFDAPEKQVGRIDVSAATSVGADMAVARCWQQWITEGRVYRRGGSGRPRNTNDRVRIVQIRRVATSAPTNVASDRFNATYLLQTSKCHQEKP